MTRTLTATTPDELRDLEWALRVGSQVYGKEHPGLISLYAQWTGEAVQPDPHPTIYTSTRETADPALRDYSETYNIPVEWSGDVAAGDRGTISPNTTAALLTAVNAYRAIAGLEPVTVDPTLAARCQAACLYISSNPGWTLDHELDPTGANYTPEAAEAARNSCIDVTREGAKSIRAYIMDDGFTALNQAVGHRQWLLLPQLQTIGIGAIPTHGKYPASTCIYIGTPKSTTRQITMWPTAGAFPHGLTPQRWSVYHPSVNLKGSTVRVNGVLTASAAYPAVGGGSILVMRPTGLDFGPQRHEVTITGPWAITYTVDRY